MIKIPELEIEVEDISDFNDRSCEILEAFCVDLQQDGNYASTDPDDIALADSEGLLFIWNGRCAKLIEQEIARLQVIGYKYFDDITDLDISTHMYNEL